MPLVLGHVSEDAGLTLGWDWLDDPRVRGGHVVHPRKARLMYGFDLRF
jgi:hypothetical protein